jgi:uncharacterized protein (DUF1501 family)
VGHFQEDPMTIQRRQLLALAGVAGVGFLTAGLGSAGEPAGVGLAALRGDRKCLIHLMLKGGNDGLNTVVPLADPLYARLRPTLAVRPAEALPLGDGLAFNPALRPLLARWEEGQCQIHLGIATPVSGSHVSATAGWHAQDGQPDAGWIAQLRPASSRADQPAYGLVFGDDHAAVAGGRMIGIAMEAANDTGFVTTTEDSPAIRHRQEMAILIRQAIAQSRSFSFPASTLGRRLQQTAAVLAAGLTPAAIAITHEGYDTHADQRGAHDALLGDLAGSLAAFATAMRAIGRWDQVVVVTGSEFGRQAAENAARGTDHGSHNCHLVMGGAVRGGFIGRQPALAAWDAATSTAGSGLRTLRGAVARMVSAPPLLAIG